MRRPRLNLEEPKEKLLFRLHFALTNSESLNQESSSLAGTIDVSTQPAKLAAEELVSEGLYTLEKDTNFIEHPVTDNLTEYEIESLKTTKLGSDLVESWPEKKYETIANNSELLPSEVSKIYQDETIEQQSEPQLEFKNFKDSFITAL